jgi:arylsulfatase A-like enzyme
MKTKIIVMLSVLAAGMLFFSCAGEKAKPHILLITIDTLRRDHLGIYGYQRETSPFIDQLARDGVMFRNVITPIPLTAASHASILTSLHPLTHHVTLNGVTLDHKVQTIAEVLKENGYYTIGAVAVGVLRKKKNFDQGFDSFSDQWEEEKHLSPKFPLAERTAPSVNKSLFKQIEEYVSKHRDKPLFIWAHYYDPHAPYYINKYTFQDNSKELKAKVINKYDGEIRYTDEHIKQLYNFLEKKGITQRLVTCITADHGEQLGEHGYMAGHMDFYSETTYVPLVLHGYGISKNKIIDTYVSTMDIGVTLLEISGLTYDYPTEGIDLRKLISKINSHRNRKFLIIGSPRYSRSVQLLGHPFAYVLNFDYHYKYWYVSYQYTPGIDEGSFKPIGKEQMITKRNLISIHPPYVLDMGRNYAVLRADIPKNEGFSFNIKILPTLRTKTVKVPAAPGKILHLEVVYPVTVLDQIRIIFQLKGNTIIENFRYAVIPGDEFPKNAKFTNKIENIIFKTLVTQRKRKKANELFDLSTDIDMEKNQVTISKHKPIIVQYTKLIYTVFKYYYNRGEKLLSGVDKDVKLTGEDKQILKSLGYL